jgi:hypothetical protein
MAGLCRPRKFQKRYDELKKAQAERVLPFVVTGLTVIRICLRGESPVGYQA